MIMVVDMKVIYTFNMSDHTKYMRVGARRHHGWQGQFGGEDQGDCRHPARCITSVGIFFNLDLKRCGDGG